MVILLKKVTDYERSADARKSFVNCRLMQTVALGAEAVWRPPLQTCGRLLFQIEKAGVFLSPRRSRAEAHRRTVFQVLAERLREAHTQGARACAAVEADYAGRKLQPIRAEAGARRAETQTGNCGAVRRNGLRCAEARPFGKIAAHRLREGFQIDVAQFRRPNSRDKGLAAE